MQALPILEGSGGGKLPPTTTIMAASSDDGEFEAIMMNNNMFHETREDFATPFSEDILYKKGARKWL